MKTKIVALFMITLAATLAFSLILPLAEAVGVTITSVSPVTKIGKVGDDVRIVGTINSTGGLYRIFFRNQLVVEQNAIGNNVNVTFKVPQAPKGNHTMTLQDFNKNINATSWFIVNTGYYVNVDKSSLVTPKQWQQGQSVTIWVNITGGEASKANTANVTVKAPSPANETYWSLLRFNTSDVGYGVNMVTYPSASFSGTLAPHTNYAGAYAVAYNKTGVTDSFSIGLTNASEYHRRQFVEIEARGYKPTESVLVNITGKGLQNTSENKVAQADGSVSANWTIPFNATVGSYTVNITSLWPQSNRTKKPVPDLQLFEVPGLGVNITARNLAKEPVPRIITLNVTDDVAPNFPVSAKDLDGDGVILLKLEPGTYSCQALYIKVGRPPVLVGRILLNITKATALDLPCNLTNLQVLVVAFQEDGSQIRIPGVRMFITPENLEFFSALNGTATVHSLLPSQNYTVNAYRYGVQFIVKTIPDLFDEGNLTKTLNITLPCPSLTLRVAAEDANGKPISDAKIKVIEVMGGLSYERSTSTEGFATLNCTLGNYTVSVYDSDGIELNQTTVSLLNLTNSLNNASVSCQLYGLAISVRVVDYFGQPVSNVNVTLHREGSASRSELTQSNGTTHFSPVTGGTLQAVIYLPGQTEPQLAATFNAAKSMAIEVKLDRYVLLAGSFVEIDHLAIVLAVLATVLLVLFVEIYRRRSPSSQKSESELE